MRDANARKMSGFHLAAEMRGSSPRITMFFISNRVVIAGLDPVISGERSAINAINNKIKSFLICVICG
jgi:hypothetical protein